jgi:hypothetical protein
LSREQRVVKGPELPGSVCTDRRRRRIAGSRVEIAANVRIARRIERKMLEDQAYTVGHLVLEASRFDGRLPTKRTHEIRELHDEISRILRSRGGVIRSRFELETNGSG